MSQWDERLDRMLHRGVETFGTEATYYPEGGAPVAVLVVFHEPGTMIDPRTRKPVETVSPTVVVEHARLGGVPKRHERIDIAKSGSYRFESVKADGAGGSRCTLTKLA